MVAEEELWTTFPIKKKRKPIHVQVPVDETMKSISIENKPEAKSVVVTSFPIEKMPKATSVLRGLGKPTTPQEPCNNERCNQQNRAKVLHYLEQALRDYNEKHGTHLMLLNLLKYEIHFFHYAHTVDFKKLYRKWIHFNLEARRLHSEKPLLLFAELYTEHDELFLTRLSLLPPIDDLLGKRKSPCTVRLPFHRFRAGFDDNCPVKKEAIQTGSMMSEGEGAGMEETCLAEFALSDYNNKNGTSLEFVKAVRCHMFPGKGLSMDFKKKETIWKHMNFVAKRPKHAVCCDECSDDCYDELLLFAELYVGDHYDEHVLATLSVVGPKDNGTKCKYCPASIQHPGCFH